MKAAMLSAWNARTPRERQVLIAGSIALALMLFYALIWHPAQRGVAALEATLPRLRADLNAMRVQGGEFARLRQMAPKSRLDAAGAMAAVQASAGKRGMERAVQRIEVMGSDRLRVVLGAAPFASWIEWIDALRRDHQLVIEAVRVDAIEQPGLAKVEMILVLPNAR